jgi:hypothetical protein
LVLARLSRVKFRFSFRRSFLAQLVIKGPWKIVLDVFN